MSIENKLSKKNFLKKELNFPSLNFIILKLCKQVLLILRKYELEVINNFIVFIKLMSSNPKFILWCSLCRDRHRNQR